MAHTIKTSFDDDKIVRHLEKGLRSVLLRKQLLKLLSNLKHLASLNGYTPHLLRFFVVGGLLFSGFWTVSHTSLADFEFMTIAVAGFSYIFSLALAMLWLLVGWFLDFRRE